MMLVDKAEPAEITKLLEQSGVPVTVLALNQSLRADYYFGGEDGKSRQFNRVQAGELFSDIDSMEDELRRYYGSADESNMIVEGLVSRVPLTRRAPNAMKVSTRAQSTGLFAHHVTPEGFIYDIHAYDTRLSEYFAWLRGLNRAGIVTYNTCNYVETATLLVAVYKNELKTVEEHQTLNRYYRPRVVIKSQSPFIKALILLSAAYKLDIGEDRATAIEAAGYKSLMDLAYTEVKELCKVKGIGNLTATKLLVALGKDL